MLTSLSIENYALIGKLRIDFDNGLNLLTGETGAGKSIIIGALSTVLGERASGDVVRTGEEKAYIEASFDITGTKKLLKALPELGIEADTSLVMSREILSAGRTQARINGRAVTQSVLRSISKALIDIHGQHEHQSLLDPESHIDLLDNLSGKELLALRQKVAVEFAKLQGLISELKSLEGGRAEREKQVDYIKYQIKEIEDAGLKDSEDEELKEERDLLANAEKLAGGMDEIKVLVEGEEGGALDKVRAASQKLKELASVNKSLAKLSSVFESAYIELDEGLRELSSYQDKIVFDPARLEEVEDRLETIRDLKRKYGDSIKKVHDTLDKMKAELEKLEVSDERIEKLRCEIRGVRGELGKKCQELSDKRRLVGKEVERALREELEELNMPRVRFQVKVENIPDEEGVPAGNKVFLVGPKGIDQIEFLISPNPGEPLKPLAKIASGGEISRIMLALKSILSKADEIPTMVFDEIDTGIGGQTATQVGKKLSALSRARQVICITHLPQIASRPGKHLHVSKSTQGNKTSVAVEELGADERIREVANLLGGGESETAIRAARELILRQ